MAISPEYTDTITIPELDTDTLTPESLIPFSNPTGKMKKTAAANVAALLNAVPKPIKNVGGVFYLDGINSLDSSKILNNYDSVTGESFNASKYATLPTGVTVDNAIWFNVPVILGSGYAKRDFTGAANVLWFGAKADGTTDDTLAINNALVSDAELIDFGGVKNTYLSGRLDLQKSNKTLTGSGATLKLKAGFSDIQWLFARGVLGYSNPSISIPLTKGQSVITTPLAVNFKAGDVIQLNGGVRFTDPISGGVYNYGLYTQIDKIVGNDIYVVVPSSHTFTATAIYSRTPIYNVNIKGITLDTNGVQGVSCINFAGVVGGGTENVTVTGNNSTDGISMFGFNLSVKNCFVSGFTNSAIYSTGYGISVVGHNITVEHCYVSNCKHTISSAARDTISTNIHYLYNVVFNGIQPALDMHANVIGGSMHKNEIFCNGVTTTALLNRGVSIDLTDNLITLNRTSTDAQGMSAIQCNESFEGSCRISGNKINVYNPNGSVGAMLIGLNTNPTVIKNLIIEGNYSNQGTITLEGVHESGVVIRNNELDAYKAETFGGVNLRCQIKGYMAIYGNIFRNRYTVAGTASLDVIFSQADLPQFIDFFENDIYVYGSSSAGAVAVRGMFGKVRNNRFFTDSSVTYLYDNSTAKTNLINNNVKVSSTGVITKLGYAALPTAVEFFAGEIVTLSASNQLKSYVCEKQGPGTYTWTAIIQSPALVVSPQFEVQRAGIPTQELKLVPDSGGNSLVSYSPTNSNKRMNIRATTDEAGSKFQSDGTTPTAGQGVAVKIYAYNGRGMLVEDGLVTLDEPVKMNQLPAVGLQPQANSDLLTRNLSTGLIEKLPYLIAANQKITANYSLSLAHLGKNGFLEVFADATTAAITITLLASSVMSGLRIRVIKTDASANAVIIKAQTGELINAANTYNLTVQYQNVTLSSNGTQFYL